MLYGIYAVRDLKTSFLAPTCDVNDSTAVRNFSHAVIASKDIMHTFKSDFELYKLGEFDSDTGKIMPFEVKELLFEGKDVE